MNLLKLLMIDAATRALRAFNSCYSHFWMGTSDRKDKPVSIGKQQLKNLSACAQYSIDCLITVGFVRRSDSGDSLMYR